MKATVCSVGCVLALPEDGSLAGLEDVLEYCTIRQEETEYQRANVIKLWSKQRTSHGEALLLPRAGFWPAADRLTLRIALPVPARQEVPYLGDLWESKRAIVTEAQRLMEAYGGCVLQLGTGQGKSKIGSYLVHSFGMRALIVVKNRELRRQAIEDYSKDLGVDPASIVRRGRSKTTEPLPNLCSVVIINSLAKDPARYFDASIGLVIYDECREYCSEVFSRVFAACPARYVLGLSADPIREDGLSKRLLAGVGPLYAPSISSKHFELHVHVVRYDNPHEYRRVILNEAGKPSLTLTLQQFAEDEERTAVVVGAIREAQSRIPEGNAVLVMGSRVVDLLRIYAAPFGAPVICQETPESERKAAFETANLIFGTYEMLGVGINITRVAAIVYATTRKTRTTQFNGRATRQDSDVTVPRHIYDIVDQGLWFQKHFTLRMEDYEARGATIVDRDAAEFLQ